MKIIVNKEITITSTVEEWWDLEPKLRPYIVVDNKAYIQKMNLGFSVKDEMKEFSLVDLESKSGMITAILPIGLWDFIKQFFDENDIQILRRAEYVNPQLVFNYGFLYDYQKEAVREMLPFYNGILKAVPGSGKTLMGIGLGLLKGKSFLWINDRIDLCKQARDKAIKFYGIPEDQCGLLQGDNEDIKPFTFTTIQKLHKVLNEGFHDQNQELVHFDTILIDECQHCVGSFDDYKQYFQALNELDYKYVYGLTATEKRVDGNEFLVFAAIGPVRWEITKKTKTLPAEVINKHHYVDTLEEVYESFINKYTSKAIPARVDNYLLFHESYFDFVKPYIDEMITKYKKVLLISPRVAGAQWISDYLTEQGKEHFLVHGKIKKREKLYTTPIIVATIHLVKEGFDVPDLEGIVVLSREIHKQIRTQIVGRCERFVEGKQSPKVYFLIPHMKRLNRKKIRKTWEALPLGEI